mgnify:CR=1 FL=1|jgi:hypothetical protein
MGKIYRRDNLIVGVKSKKKNDKNRKKCAYVNFRVTPEEKEVIFKRIALFRMLVQKYVAQSCMHNKVTAVGNVKIFDVIKKEMEAIDRHLLSVQRADELDRKVLESLRAVLEILDRFYNNDEEAGGKSRWKIKHRSTDLTES